MAAYTSYNPPKNSTAASTDDSWWMDLMRLYYGYKMETRDPKFSAPPLTPEQKQLWNLYLKTLTNPAFDNAAGVAGMGKQILGGYQNLGWDAPTTSTGQTGYKGSQTPFNANWSASPPGGPTFDPTLPPSPPSGGGGGFEGPAVEDMGGRGQRLPTVQRDGGGGFNSPSIKPFNDPTYSDLNRSPYTPGHGDPLWRDRSMGEGAQDWRDRLPAFADWVRQYGKPAAEIIFAIWMQNPALGVKGAVDAWKARQGGNP